jgi:hypothetical protein
MKAFLRERKDDDGITVVPEACLCCQLDIVAIGAITVGAIESLSNPVTSEQLYVYQDAEDHALIMNLPYREEHRQEASRLAFMLAGMCKLLTKEEFVEAKQEWTNRSAASNAGSVSEQHG